MDREKLLKYYLYIFGFLNIFIISFTIPVFFGDRLLWHPRNIPTDMMLGSIYFSIGVIMILAARKPLSHHAFVDFVIFANILHAIIMLIYARSILHIVIDAGSIGIMGALPLFFYPWDLKNFLRY